MRQNLELHARLFQLPPDRTPERVVALLRRFELEGHADDLAETLPLGIRQRLSLAVAVVHEPEILILDEPTSGVDPVARDRFWELLIDLSRRDGVTIFVSTHFMNEGRALRPHLPDARRSRAGHRHPGRARPGAGSAATLEEAFVAYLEEAGREAGVEEAAPPRSARRYRGQPGLKGMIAVARSPVAAPGLRSPGEPGAPA